MSVTVRGYRGALGIVVACGIGSMTAGCDMEPLGTQVCTQAGCSDGLLVSFDAPAPDGTIVEVRDERGARRTLECGVDWNCDTDVFFEDFRPRRVTVRVSTPGGQAAEVFVPVYGAVRPNGPDCEPTCLQAEVSMALPAGAAPAAAFQMA